MNTAGKSDIFEAVIQILILKTLQEHGLTQPALLAAKVGHRAAILPYVDEHSIYIALSKLETSGWIKMERVAPTEPRYGKWELTKSASKYLPRELNQWKTFIDSWPHTVQLLKAAVESETL